MSVATFPSRAGRGQRSPRELLLIGACVLAALYFGAPALWQALTHRGPSAAASQLKLQKAQAALRSDSTALSQLQSALGLLASRQPPSALSARTAAELDQRARAVGIRLREVKPLPPHAIEGAIAVPLQLTFTAPFPQAARFLAGLRSYPGALAVDRAVIAASTANSNQVSVNLRVLVFSQSAEKQETTRGQS